MKQSKFLASAFVFLSLLAFTSCGGKGGGDDTPQLTPTEQRLVDLAGTSGVTWTATSVTFDGGPTNGLENFSITFRGNANSKTYNSVDGSPFLGASGTWNFVGTNINQITFDSNTENVYALSLNTSASPQVLTMTVNYTSNGGARAGASGTYVFTLQNQ
ncbi:MAG TPA: hypothetical protein VIN11_03955 [Roseivirga sp.]